MGITNGISYTKYAGQLEDDSRNSPHSPIADFFAYKANIYGNTKITLKKTLQRTPFLSLDLTKDGS